MNKYKGIHINPNYLRYPEVQDDLKKPKIWINPLDAYNQCEISRDEYEKALVEARKDITAGKKPAKGSPHLIITIGAPGSGKSSVMPIVAKYIDKYKYEDYVVIDLDLAIKYHPRYRNIWTPYIESENNTSIDVGYTQTYAHCNDQLVQMMWDLYNEFVYKPTGEKYNIIMQTHWHHKIIEAKLESYSVSLVFVGVSLEVAISRAKKRAIKTGMFLTPTLVEQESAVISMWFEYLKTAPWFGLWADEFIIVDNNKNSVAGQIILDKSKIKKIDLRCKDWLKCIKEATKEMERVCQYNA